MLIDTHCHLCSFPNPMEILKEASDNNVSEIISISLNRTELDTTLRLKSDMVKLYAGVHPFYKESNHDFINQLPSLLKNGIIQGIGEIGLDARNADIEWQKKILLTQLDIANQYDVPVSFHCIKQYYQLAKLLKENFPNISGTIHGFIGNSEMYHLFDSFDIKFGINTGVLNSPKTMKVYSKSCNLSRFVLETDAPYTHNHSYPMDKHPYYYFSKFIESLFINFNLNIAD